MDGTAKYNVRYLFHCRVATIDKINICLMNILVLQGILNTVAEDIPKPSKIFVPDPFDPFLLFHPHPQSSLSSFYFSNQNSNQEV